MNTLLLASELLWIQRPKRRPPVTADTELKSSLKLSTYTVMLCHKPLQNSWLKIAAIHHCFRIYASPGQVCWSWWVLADPHVWQLAGGSPGSWSTGWPLLRWITLTNSLMFHQASPERVSWWSQSSKREGRSNASWSQGLELPLILSAAFYWPERKSQGQSRFKDERRNLKDTLQSLQERMENWGHFVINLSQPLWPCLLAENSRSCWKSIYHLIYTFVIYKSMYHLHKLDYMWTRSFKKVQDIYIHMRNIHTYFICTYVFYIYLHTDYKIIYIIHTYTIYTHI